MANVTTRELLLGSYVSDSEGRELIVLQTSQISTFNLFGLVGSNVIETIMLDAILPIEITAEWLCDKFGFKRNIGKNNMKYTLDYFDDCRIRIIAHWDINHWVWNLSCTGSAEVIPITSIHQLQAVVFFLDGVWLDIKQQDDAGTDV